MKPILTKPSPIPSCIFAPVNADSPVSKRILLFGSSQGKTKILMPRRDLREVSMLWGSAAGKTTAMLDVIKRN